MRVTILLLLMTAACAKAPANKTSAQATPAPVQTSPVSKALCDEMSAAQTENFIMYTKDGSFYLLQSDKFYSFDMTTNRIDLVPDGIVNLDGICEITVSGGSVTNIETLPSPTPAPSGGWNPFR